MAAMTVDEALQKIEAALMDIPWPTPDADQALATLRDAAKDARRYRWLRDGLEANATDAYEIAEFGYRGGVDAAIDVAMGVQP